MSHPHGALIFEALSVGVKTTDIAQMLPIQSFMDLDARKWATMARDHALGARQQRLMALAFLSPLIKNAARDEVAHALEHHSGPWNEESLSRLPNGADIVDLFLVDKHNPNWWRLRSA